MTGFRPQGRLCIVPCQVRMNKKTTSVSQGVGPIAIRSHPVNGILQYLEQAVALALWRSQYLWLKDFKQPAREACAENRPANS